MSRKQRAAVTQVIGNLDASIPRQLLVDLLLNERHARLFVSVAKTRSQSFSGLETPGVRLMQKYSRMRPCLAQGSRKSNII